MKNKLLFWITIWLIAVFFFGYFALSDVLSTGGIYVSQEAKGKYFDCAFHYYSESEHPQFVQCLEKITLDDYSFSFLFWRLAQEYNYDSFLSNQNGDLQTSIILKFKAVEFVFHSFMSAFSLPIWVAIFILGLYTLLYDRVSDLTEKVFEGLITGISISAYLYFAQTFFVKSRSVGSFEFERNEAYVEVPYSFYILVALFFLCWISIDLRKKKYENIIAKVIFIITSLLFLLLFPHVDNSRFANVKFFLMPIVAILISIGYYYWREISDKRKQIGLIAYLVIALGLITATIRNFDFLTVQIFLGVFSLKEIADVASDFLIFLLGFLLTLLELNKEKPVEIDRTSTTQAQAIKIDEPIHQPEHKSQSSISFLKYLLMSIIAIIFFNEIKKVFESKNN